MQIKQLAYAIGMIGAATIASGAYAADDTAAVPAPQKVQKIEVTGSNIRRVNTETASPVQTVSREQIQRSGLQSITEVLQDLSAQQGSFSDITGSASFAPGASSASLRGLGPQATLVLLNGRRLSTYGFAVGAQTSFVDIDTVPLSIVERIDVLKDGASAIYGSEAMAGVINIITRKDYQGVDISATHTASLTYHNGDVNRGSITGGYGDIGANHFNVFGTFDFYKRNAVGFRERPDLIKKQYVDSFNLGGMSTYIPWGNLYDADTFAYKGTQQACPATQNLDIYGHVVPVGTPGSRCRVDGQGYGDLIPKAERYNFFGGATFAINDSMTAFAEVGYTNKKGEYNGAPQAIGDPSASFNPVTNDEQDIYLLLPPGSKYNPIPASVSPDGVFMRYRFNDVGPTKINYNTKDKRIVGGLKGSLGDWDYEASAGHLSSDTNITYHGEIRYSVFKNAVDNGTYVFNNRAANGEAFYAALSPDMTNRGNTSANIFSLKANDSALFSLPGGQAGVALGLEHRTENFSSLEDPLFEQGDVLNYGQASASGSRNVTSLYGELALPVVKSVELSLAARTDHYSDYGTSTTPKVGIKWQPAQSLALRATYAEGFRAPSLVEIGTSNSTGFYTVVDPIRCPVTGADSDCSASLPVRTEANPNLKAEKSKSFTAGFVLEPTKGFNFSMDYYKIKRNNEIASLDPNFLLSHADQFPDNIFRRAPLAGDPPGLPGPLQYMKTMYANLGATTTSGVDIEANLRMGLRDLGRLNTRFDGTYVISLKSAAVPGADMVENIATYDAPRFKGGITTSWDYQAYSTDLAINYVSGYGAQLNNNASCPTASSNPGLCQVASFTTADIGLGYTGFKNLTLRAKVRNVFNRKAPVDVGAASIFDVWNTDAHSVDGRVLSITADYSFK